MVWTQAAFMIELWIVSLDSSTSTKPWSDLDILRLVLKSDRSQCTNSRQNLETSVHKALVNFLWEPSQSQFSHSVISDSLQPHRLQHTRAPFPSWTAGVYPNSCPSNQWCHPTISPSFFPSSSCLQSFPASGSFQMSQLSTSGGQRIGVSASTSVLPMNIQDVYDENKIQNTNLTPVLSLIFPLFSS